MSGASPGAAGGAAAAIAPTAVVDPKARLGRGVTVGHGSIVYGNVEIGDGTRIGELCVIGHPAGPGRPPLRIGRDSLVRSHSVLYEGSTLGDRLETGHHVLIRENTTAGVNLRAGGQCQVQGDCVLGDYVRLHTSVQVGKGTRIGHFVWVFPNVVFTNDPLPPSELEVPVTVEDGAVISTAAILMPGTTVGFGAFIGACARASGAIPPGAVVEGNPGQVVGDVRRLLSLEHGLRHPWMNHFHRGYPDDARARLQALKQKLQSLPLGSPAR